MKYSIKSMIFGGTLLFVLSMCLASCEGALDDIFGKWAKPSTVPSTVVEEAGVLGAALKTGAKVAITYTVGAKTYKATFTKNSDDSYTLDSNDEITPSATRGMTRSAVPTFVVPTGTGDIIGSLIQLVRRPEKLQFSVSSSANVPLFKADLRIDDGRADVTNLNGAALDCTIKNVDVNNEKANVQIPEKLSVKITVDEISYAVKFSEGDTWADVAESNKENHLVKIATTTDDYISVNLSWGFVVNTLTEAGETQFDAAEDLYNSTYSATFYLIIGTDTYVKASDEVGPDYSYTLTTTEPPVTVDLSTVSGDTYNVTENVIFTGTPSNDFTIKYNGNDFEVTLDNVNSEGSKQVLISGNDNYNINIKLKGTSRLTKIDAGYYKTVTIGETAVGGTVIVKGADENLIKGKTVTINGGTVKAKANEGSAVYVENNGDLIIKGGALYLQAGGSDYPAVGKTASGDVTLYGWDGSSWGAYTAGAEQKYATTDTSAAPSTWTW